MAKAVRITAWSMAALMLAAMLALAGAVGFAHTDTGRAWLADVVSRQLSPPGEGEVRLSGLSGSLFKAWRLESLTIADGEGVWLTVADLEMRWRPWSLTGARLEVDRLSAAVVDVERIPKATGEVPPTDEAAARALPDLGALSPVDVDLRELVVDRVRLGPAVAGGEIALSVTGAARLDRAGAGEVTLAVDRVVDGSDGVETAGHARLHARLDPNGEAIDLSLDVQEPADGVIARLADLPGRPPVSATIDGDGPVDDWRGKVLVTAGGETSLAGDITLALVPELRLSIAADVRAGGVVAATPGLDDTARSLLSRPARVAATVALPGGERRAGEVVAVEAMHIANDALDIAGSGTFDLLGQASDASLTVDVLAPDALRPWLAPADFRSASLRARLTGALAAPVLSLDLRAADVRADQADPGGLAAAQVTLNAEVRPDGTIGQAGLRLPVTGTLRLEGVRAASIAPADALIGGDPVTIDFDGAFDVDGMRLDPLRVVLDAAGAGASIAGNLDFARSTAALLGDATIADIAPFLSAAGLEGQGRAAIDVDVSSADLAHRWAGQVRVRLDEVVMADAVIDAVVGDAADVAGAVDVTLAGGDPLTVEGLTIETAAGFSGEGGLRLAADDRLEARLNARLAEAGRLGAALGVEMAGAASAEVAFSGPVDNPALDGAVSLARLGGGAAALDEVTLSGRLADLASVPTGRLRARGQGPVGVVEAATDLAVTGDAVRLPRLAVEMGGARVAGDLTVENATGIARGRLTVVAPDLSPWGGLAGVDLAGALDGVVDLDGRDGRQAVDLTLTARELGLPDGPGGGPRARRVEATAALRLGGEAGLAGQGRVVASTVDLDAAVLDQVSVAVDGDLDRAAFTLDAVGEEGVAVELSLGGAIALRDGESAVDVTSLEGRLAETALSLDGEAHVRVGANAVEASLDALRIGADGRVQAELTRGPDGLDASLTARAVPAALASAIALPAQLDGPVDIDGRLSRPAGDRALPQARFNLRAPSLTVRGAGLDEAPPLALEAEAQIGDGVALVAGSLRGIGPEPLVAGMSVPVMPGRDGGIALNRRGAVSGRLNWHGDVAVVSALAGLDTHRLTGRVDAEITLSGPVTRAVLEGGVSLRGGTYENLDSGTTLTDLALSTTLAGDSRVDISLTARDGGGGRVEGGGQVDFSDLAQPTAKLNLDLQDATLVRRDELTATTRGRLSFGGDPGQGKLAGAITVTRAEINIPERLPPSVVELDVIEVGGDDGDGAGAEDEDEAAEADLGSGIALDIALNAPRRVFVRGRGLDTEWSADLRVRGTAAAPRLTGRLSVVRGEATIVGQTLDLERGEITFDGKPDPDPRLDVEAALPAKDISAWVDVGGRASAPEISLRSLPSMPEEEILARAFFGKSTSELGALEAVRLAQAAAELTGSGGGGFDPTEFARQLLGVDVLRVEGGEEGGGAAVRAGKYVSEDIYLGVRQGTGEGTGAVTVEIEVLPDVDVETEFGQSGESSVGIRWKYDY